MRFWRHEVQLTRLPRCESPDEHPPTPIGKHTYELATNASRMIKAVKATTSVFGLELWVVAVWIDIVCLISGHTSGLDPSEPKCARHAKVTGCCMAVRAASTRDLMPFNMPLSM